MPNNLPVKCQRAFFICTLCVFFYSVPVFSQTTVVDYNFNSDDAGWVLTSSTNGDWNRGVDVFSESSDGTSYWYISPSNYNDEASTVLESPSIDFTAFSDLVLSLDIRYDTESEYDGFQIQYNDGGGWNVLGSVDDGLNWYNDTDVNGITDETDGWTGDNEKWQTAYVGLPVSLNNNSSVRFRVVFGSDFSTNDRGAAFDNFTVVSGGTEIAISANGVEIENGDLLPSISDNTDFYAVALTSGLRTRLFSVTNIAGGTLILDGVPLVSITGDHAGDFTVTQPVASSIGGGETQEFSISFDPSATGVREAIVSIENDDSDEDPYTFKIQGLGVDAMHAYNFNSGLDGWAVTSGWTNGNSTYDDGADGDFIHLTNMSDYFGGTTAIITSPTLDLSGATELYMYIDIRYDTETDYDGMYIEYSTDDGSSWNGMGSVGDGVNWYTGSIDAIGADGWSGHSQYWLKSELQLPSALNGDSDAKFRMIFTSDGSVNDLGVAFDNVMIVEGFNDIKVQGNGIDIVDGSEFTESDNLTDFRNVDVANGTRTAIYTIQNRGGTTLNLTGPNPVSISGGDVADFSVTSQPSVLSLEYLESTTFSITFNPSSTGSKVTSVSIVSDDPDQATFEFYIVGTGDNALYYYDFDASDEGWTVTTATVGNWVRGTSILNAGASGSYWYNSPSNYSNSDLLVIESPTMDLTSSTAPFLTVDVRYDTDSNDGMRIEYSDDDGTSWYRLSGTDHSLKWYNDEDVQGFASNVSAWSGDNQQWQTAEVLLPDDLIGNSTVKIRFLFASDAAGNDVGVAFDNFAVFGMEIIVPVELLSFTGEFEEDIIKLNWVTASEMNNDYFIVQRSIDGKEYSDLGTVLGNGTSNEQNSYSYLDNQLTKNQYFYRLKQVDFDGVFEIFDPIIVRRDDELLIQSSLYPNPLEGDVLNVIVDDKFETAQIAIYNLMGHEVYRIRQSINNGYIELALRNKLPTGAYIVKVKAGSYETNLKLIKN